MPITKTLTKNQLGDLLSQIKQAPDLLKSKNLDTLKQLWQVHHPGSLHPKQSYCLL